MCVQKRREREMQQQMESRDEETLELKETYTSLQQEVDIKTKKLKKVRMVVNICPRHYQQIWFTWVWKNSELIPKCQNSFCFHVDTKEKEELSSESTLKKKKKGYDFTISAPDI